MFGDQYRDYKKRVSMLLPRKSALTEPDFSKEHMKWITLEAAFAAPSN